MKKAFLLALGPAVLSGLSATLANAEIIEMRVSKLPSGADVRCPDKVMLTETRNPYREGSFGTNGFAKLDAIAESFAIASTDDFSVVWAGKLKPQYSKCKATAGMAKWGKETYTGHSYLRMRFVGGKAYLILDMTGKRDPNNFTTVIVKKSVQNGNPTWSWGGTD